MDRKCILVTGSRGFLGSLIAARLAGAGHEVWGFDRAPLFERSQAGVHELVGDLLAAAAGGTVAGTGPKTGLPELPARLTAVVHAAAQLPGDVDESEMLFVNAALDQAVAKLAVAREARQVVFLSSCSVYGYTRGPAPETTLPAPTLLYAVSKLAGELAIPIVGNGRFRCCVLRVSAPYGPTQRRPTVITRFVDQARQKGSVSLWAPGRRTQDFVYADDVATACLAAVEAEASGTFNLSGDHPVTMLDLARLVLTTVGRPAEAIEITGQDPQADFVGAYPIAAAQAAFGYRPQVSLADGVKRVVAARQG